MGRGDLPADGAPRLGPVQLPPGRRIVPWDGPGQPAAWVTREPVPQPGPVWSALSGLHAGTGLVPVLLADDADPDYDFGFAVPCDPAEIDQVDPVQILAPRWDGRMADQAEAARGPHGPWPTPRTTEFLGLVPRTDGGPTLDGIVMAVLRAATVCLGSWFIGASRMSISSAAIGPNLSVPLRSFIRNSPVGTSKRVRRANVSLVAGAASPWSLTLQARSGGE